MGGGPCSGHRTGGHRTEGGRCTGGSSTRDRPMHVGATGKSHYQPPTDSRVSQSVHEETLPASTTPAPQPVSRNPGRGKIQPTCPP